MIEDLHRIIYATLKAALPTTDSLHCDDKHLAGHLYNPLESNSKTATAACQNTSKETCRTLGYICMLPSYIIVTHIYNFSC